MILYILVLELEISVNNLILYVFVLGLEISAKTTSFSMYSKVARVVTHVFHF